MVTIFLIGIIVAVLVEEFTGIVPGGYIVPGALALSATDPWQLAATLAIALLTMISVRGLERVILIYGRRRLGMAILTGALLKLLLVEIAPRLRWLPAAEMIVGYVVPGLLAERFIKQGIPKTLTAITLATAITWLAGIAVVG